MAMVESVRYIIRSTADPSDFFATKASSAIIMIAESSFLGMVALISLDLDDSRLHVQDPSYSFLPAYIAAPPADFAASLIQINLIPEMDLEFGGIVHLGEERYRNLTNCKSLDFQNVSSSGDRF